jgi:hypothetical protein
MEAHSTFVLKDLESLATPLTAWAGPFFEQTHLATLKALDSHTCYSATIPGPNFFMQKHVVPNPGEEFLKHKEDPYQHRRTLLPAGLHAHGKRNKELLHHLQFDMWMPLDIALAGIGKATPFFCRNKDSIDLGLAVWMRACSRFHHEKSKDSDWERIDQSSLISRSIGTDLTMQPLLTRRFPIFRTSDFTNPENTKTEPGTDTVVETMDRRRSNDQPPEVKILCCVSNALEVHMFHLG